MQHLAGGVQSTRPTVVTQGSHNSHENLFNQKEGRTSTTNCEFYCAGSAGATSQSFTFKGINTELLCNRLGESKKGQHPVQPLHRADTGPRERTREKGA